MILVARRGRECPAAEQHTRDGRGQRRRRRRRGRGGRWAGGSCGSPSEPTCRPARGEPLAFPPGRRARHSGRTHCWNQTRTSPGSCCAAVASTGCPSQPWALRGRRTSCRRRQQTGLPRGRWRAGRRERSRPSLAMSRSPCCACACLRTRGWGALTTTWWTSKREVGGSDSGIWILGLRDADTQSSPRTLIQSLLSPPAARWRGYTERAGSAGESKGECRIVGGESGSEGFGVICGAISGAA